MAKLPISAGCPRTKRSPSAIDASTGSDRPDAAGRCGRMAQAAATMAAQLAASNRYAEARPSTAIIAPPSAGPTTIVSW